MQRKNTLIWLLATILLLPSAVVAQQPVRWEPTLENAQRAAGQANRLVLIQFWAPWCAVCRQAEADVLGEPSVVAALAANYVPVKVNADHFPATARQYNVTALPTTVIATPQGQPLDVIRGRVEAAEFSARLNKLAAETKRRTEPLYAQVSAATTSPVASTPPPGPTPPAASPASMTAAQPSNLNGPELIANTPPPVAANQPAAGAPGLSDDRYADFFRGNRAEPVAPIGQPPSVSPGQAAYQPPPPPAQQPAANPAPTAPIAPILTASVAPSTQTVPYPAATPQPPVPTVHPPLGLDGYCPVTLSEKQQWVAGDRRWGAIHRGRTYLFAGPDEQRRFFAEPDRYAPAVSGNDVVLATEQGQAAPGMREHGVFFGNRVYLFANEATLERFARNPNQYANQVAGAVKQ